MSASQAWFQPSSEPPPPVPVPAADSSTCRPGNRPRMTAKRSSMWPQTVPVADNHQAYRSISYALLHDTASHQKKVGQTVSLPSLPDRPHRRSQGKAASLPYPRAALFNLSGAANGMKAPQKKCTVGCPTCGGLINEAFSCHQAAWLRSLRRLDNLRYIARRAFHSFRASQRDMLNSSEFVQATITPTWNADE